MSASRITSTVGAPSNCGKRQKWFLSDAGRNLILARYDGREETINELVTMLKVPRWRLRRWAIELGLTRARTKEPPWTEEELAYLETNLKRMSVTAIAQHLGRTKDAVRVKAKRWGVNKQGSDYTMRRLCDCLGVDHHKVERWLRDGWLKGTRRKSERVEAQGGDMWLFTNEAIREFIRRHPAEIDPRRVSWIWVVDILAGIISD
jgi:hypothetical protein